MASDLATIIRLGKGQIRSCSLSADNVYEILPKYCEDFSDGLIIGYGTVGEAMDEILVTAGFMCDIIDPMKFQKIRCVKNRYDVLHICFPCYNEETFINYVVGYIDKFNPKYVLIYSTIGIFTAEKIIQGWDTSSLKLFHIPIRGVELNGVDGIKNFISFVGPAEGVKHFADVGLDWYLDRLGMKHEWVSDSRTSALGKLICTSWYGMNIAFSNLVAKITDKHGISFHGSYIRPMETDKIGKKYYKIGGKVKTTEFIDRPINRPGQIGGHCVMPNLNLLPEEADQLVKWIEEMHNYMVMEEEKLDKGKKETMQV